MGLMLIAEVPFDLAAASPILDLAFALAGLTFALAIEVLELECLVAAEFACIAGGALEACEAILPFIASCTVIELAVLYRDRFRNSPGKPFQFRVPAHPTI